MWVMKPADRAELERYRATGLTPEDVERLAGGVLPDDDDRAPLPFSDPAMASVEAYEDCWHDERVHTGLLCEEA